jgi:hypothetical protein
VVVADMPYRIILAMVSAATAIALMSASVIFSINQLRQAAHSASEVSATLIILAK